MLDRMSLSIKNRWLDEEDRVYIFFSVEEIMEMLNCGRNKAVNCLKELDQETMESVSAALTIDPELFYDVAASYNYVVKISDAADASLQETIEFLVNIDVIGESFDITEYFDSSYIESAEL